MRHFFKHIGQKRPLAANALNCDVMAATNRFGHGPRQSLTKRLRMKRQRREGRKAVARGGISASRRSGQPKPRKSITTKCACREK
jgi:hypothetical protein